MLGVGFVVAIGIWTVLEQGGVGCGEGFEGQGFGGCGEEF